MKFSYDPGRTAAPLRAALAAIAASGFPISIAKGKAATLSLELAGDGPRFEVGATQTRVTGKTIPHVLRALATLRGFAEAGKAPPRYEEASRLDTLGLMLDCSRNAVPLLSTVKLFLSRMALMGMNLFMLYTEDTYEVPGEPHIGYLRGRFTQKEIRELDAYAATLGIEMIPCIQTLAHLAQPLRWWKQYGGVTGSEGVLRIGEPKTYELVEKMIRAASGPYRSKRIHLGMDEAALGHGKNKPAPGKTNFDLMTDHLARVVEIAVTAGLEPMIWSDMFFTIAREHGGNVPPEVAAKLPGGVRLVYWDYYQCDPAGYEKQVDLHRAMGKEPIFAPGLWTDNVWWGHFTHARLDTDAGMIAMKNRGVREAFTTLWGDDGAAGNMMSALPAIQHFAEHGYRDTVSDADLSRQVRGSCGWDLEAMRTGEQIDSPPTLAPTLREWADHMGMKMPAYVDDLLDTRGINFFGHNPGNYLLWNDPMVGIYDGHLEKLPLAAEYAKVAANLAAARKAGPCEKNMLGLVYELARVLEVKADLGVRLREAYMKKDRKALARLSKQTLPEALRRVKRAHEAHRVLWFTLYKPNGYEVQDLRWSGLEGRLRSAKLRVDDYLAGRVDALPELAEKRLVISDFPKGKLGYGGPSYRKIVSASLIT